MLAKCSLIASMFDLEDDANLHRRQLQQTPRAYHICSLLAATAKKFLTAPFLVSNSTDQSPSCLHDLRDQATPTPSSLGPSCQCVIW